jgi:hypothetical protein
MTFHEPHNPNIVKLYAIRQALEILRKMGFYEIYMEYNGYLVC